MRSILPLGALALFALVQPASAQMCGAGQQAQASSSTGAGMMCGMGNMAADDPMADPAAKKPQAGGMCPCCQKMGMMKGGGMQHDMPGMDKSK